MEQQAVFIDQASQNFARAAVGRRPLERRWIQKLINVNKELWLIFTILAIAWFINSIVGSQRLLLSFFTLPTLFSAYFYGRRHATMTAILSALVVGLVCYSNPLMFTTTSTLHWWDKWFDILLWTGFLVVTAYSMGTLYEGKEHTITELRETYHGILLILQQFIAKDKYTQNHSYRVSVYAGKIAVAMGMNRDRVEDVRASALLHDIGKLDISREILYKAARLTAEEFEAVQKHVDYGMDFLEPVGGSLRRVLPIILAHHDRFDGAGYHATSGLQIPIESRILSVADVYDALTSDRPYRKAMPPLEAKQEIVRNAGTQFDPEVVQAFEFLHMRGEMEVPDILV
jgi:HD-GYP domain-containing protein (c-di-GMP phosphodiesterase class II)